MRLAHITHTFVERTRWCWAANPATGPCDELWADTPAPEQRRHTSACDVFEARGTLRSRPEERAGNVLDPPIPAGRRSLPHAGDDYVVASLLHRGRASWRAPLVFSLARGSHRGSARGSALGLFPFPGVCGVVVAKVSFFKVV